MRVFYGHIGHKERSNVDLWSDRTGRSDGSDRCRLTVTVHDSLHFLRVFIDIPESPRVESRPSDPKVARPLYDANPLFFITLVVFLFASTYADLPQLSAHCARVTARETCQFGAVKLHRGERPAGRAQLLAKKGGLPVRNGPQCGVKAP